MKKRLIVVGGFLGAGKTTLLIAASHALRRRGYRVGVVVNDQSADLVDTALLRSLGIIVGEVSGGCFCCRFPDLEDAVSRVPADVDVVLAEPVGSCTDLVATVLRPLVKQRAHDLIIAPLSVVVDPRCFASITNERVRYLYQQQLNEADIVVVNKSDVVGGAEAGQLLQPLETAIDGTETVRVSARTGFGVDSWLELVLDRQHASDQDLVLDYDLYAAAEACLAWLNARGTTSGAGTAQRVRDWMEALLGFIRTGCVHKDLEIAHAKLLVRGSGVSDAKAGLADNKGRISWDADAPDGFTGSEFVLNVRADGAPEALERVVESAFERAAITTGVRTTVSRSACFSPPRPTPFHRLRATADSSATTGGR
jgi:Ni2+-binding GTPase involved in maturation of urease and hydrogenase